MAAIRVENMTLEYPVIGAQSRAPSSGPSKKIGGAVSRGRGNLAFVKALEDITFTLSAGDSVGLVGHNGSGKSTLLRVLAGIYQPTQGRVVVEGHIAAMLELGAGMEMELSGSNNIRRLGLLVGLPDHRIGELTEEIVDFCELGDFLHLPMRTYSSGMVMRLAFAIRTALSPDVLLIDEMFGVGDASFQKKAQARLTEMIGRTRTLVMASHSPDLLKRFCRRGMLLEKGRLTALDDIHTVCAMHAESQGT